jgi:hypothetical protein
MIGNMDNPRVDQLRLREAIEKSWQRDTANLKVEESGNPALGQCYPTSRVVQHYFPETEIAEGEVLTPGGPEKHFWNVIRTRDGYLHIDFTWQQFPSGSSIRNWKIRDRRTLNDSPPTVKRVELLLSRVRRNLA